MDIWTLEYLQEVSQEQLHKIKVLFFVYFPSVWDSQRSVYQAMKANPAFEVYVLIAPVPDTKDNLVYKENAVEFFSKECENVIIGYNHTTASYINIESLNMDIIFYQTPFYYGICDYYPEYLAEHTYLAYIPYGFYIAGIHNIQFNQILHNVAWKVFAETPLHKELYAKHKLTGDYNVVVTGYPKLDVYLSDNTIEDANTMWKFSTTDSPYRKRILWTPHWIVDEKTKYTLFAEYIEFFIDYLKRNTESIEIILKPHPLLFETLIKTGVYTEEELHLLLERFQSLPNGSLHTGGNYFPLFFSSDGMINSSISFLAEYLPTKKPMLFMPNINDLGINEFGERIRNHHYMGYSTKDIEDFITQVVIEGNDPMYEQREEAIQNVLYMPQEGAGTLIAKEVERSIHNDEQWIRKQKLLAIRTRLAQKKANKHASTYNYTVGGGVHGL